MIFISPYLVWCGNSLFEIVDHNNNNNKKTVDSQQLVNQQQVSSQQMTCSCPAQYGKLSIARLLRRNHCSFEWRVTFFLQQYVGNGWCWWWWIYWKQSRQDARSWNSYRMTHVMFLLRTLQTNADNSLDDGVLRQHFVPVTFVIIVYSPIHSLWLFVDKFSFIKLWW